MKCANLIAALAVLLISTVVIANDEKPVTKENHQSAFIQRLSSEADLNDVTFALTPFKPNYLLPLAYNFSVEDPNDELDDAEINFQFSVRLPVVTSMFDGKGTINVAYTARSFWQAYNQEYSAPFRDTNHEPEIFFSYRTHDLVRGHFQFHGYSLGVVHQSNGRSQPLSRSWNRIYLSTYFEYQDLYFDFKPWWRIPESGKDSPLDPKGDDNPDIDEYLGNFELLTVYKHNEHTFSWMSRYNFDSDGRGATELSWSYPIPAISKVKGYVKIFNGYGETLLNYDDSSMRLSLGFVLSDWL